MAMILRTVEPQRGAHWVRDALRLYLRKPLPFTALFVIFMIVAQLISLLPVVGPIVVLMMVPLLSLGMMVASQSVLLEGPVKPGQFVEPFRGDRRSARALIVLCGLFALLMVLSLSLVNITTDNSLTRLTAVAASPNRTPAENAAVFADRSVMAGALIASLVITALSVPFWHAPALVHWGGQGPWQALFSSTLAVWRARGAFVVYGLVWFAICLLSMLASAIVMALLGGSALTVLVLAPLFLFLSTLFYISLIFSFNDSFGTHSA